MLLAVVLLAGHLTFAQVYSTTPDAPPIKGQITAAPAHANTQKAIPFWTEDFSAGFPASWTLIDSSGICPWTYSDDGSWGNFNGNSATAGAAGISSTSAANGFLICDQDSANHFTYGQPSSTNYQYLSSYFATSAINCSGRSSVILSFEQFFRYNNGVSLNVQVSNNGTTWTTYDVSGGVANNTASANADLVTLNISNEAANQTTVYLRFGWSARVYYWMIDDIALSEADPNDAIIGDNWWGWGQGQRQYYKMPMNQVTPVTFYSEVANNTGATLNNVFSEVTVNNPAQVFQGTSSQMSLAAVEMDTFVVATNWTPSTVGSYTVDFTCDLSGATDGNPLNNDDSDSLMVTATLYGVDNLTNGSESTASISNFSNNTGQEFRIGNVYEIVNNDEIQCIEIGIANAAQNDAKPIYAEVHVWDPVNEVWELRGTTDIYDITTGDLGQIISLPLFTPASVLAGEEALVVAGHYGGAIDGSDDVRFMYAQAVPEGMVYGFDATGSDFFLANPRAIVVRAQFDCGLSVEEYEMTDLSVYPNPAHNELNVQFTATGGKVLLSLVDAQGKEVLQEVLTSGNNSYSTSLNTSGLAGGVYTLKLNSEGNNAAKRVVLF